MSVGNWVSFSFLKNFKSIFQDESTPRLQYPALTSDLLSSDAPLIETKSPKKMRQNENRSRMIRSDGLTVARTHMYDWFILAVLIVILAIIHAIHPFYRFVGKDMMTDLKYPLKSNTVPFWAVPVYSVALPMAIFIIVYLRRRDVYDLHHAVLGLLYSALVTAVITNSIKAAVGRPRPDFFWRCFPDGKDVYDRFGNVICHGRKNIIDEGHRSFPSGHTSWSFSGLVFLSLYLAGKIKAFDRKGHIAKLCLIFFPIVAASLVGISRVDDYKHHWQDVFAGGLLGLVVAAFCYLQFFPPPYHAQGWVPYACFQHSESRPEVPLTGDAPINEVVMEGRPNETSGGNGCIGLSMPHASDTAPEDIESGVR